MSNEHNCTPPAVEPGVEHNSVMIWECRCGQVWQALVQVERANGSLRINANWHRQEAAPDLASFTQAELATCIADAAITETVRGYAKEMLAQRMLEEYQAAVDHKYDNTIEGTPAWQAAEAKCDRLVWEYVVAVHGFFPERYDLAVQ